MNIHDMLSLDAPPKLSLREREGLREFAKALMRRSSSGTPIELMAMEPEFMTPLAMIIMLGLETLDYEVEDETD